MPIEVPPIPEQPADGAPWADRMRWAELAMQRALVLATIESATATDRHAVVSGRLMDIAAQSGIGDAPTVPSSPELERRAVAVLLAQLGAPVAEKVRQAQEVMSAADQLVGFAPPAHAPAP